MAADLAKLKIEKDTLSSAKAESSSKVEQLLRELSDFRLESEKVATALKAESAAKANEVVSTTSKLKTLEQAHSQLELQHSQARNDIEN